MAVETTDVGDVNDEYGTVPKTFHMVVDEKDVVIYQARSVPPKYEYDETSNNDTEVSDMIESTAIGRPIRYLNVTAR